MLKSEIRTATVTRVVLHSPDSIIIDADLVDAADLVAGERGSGVVAVNGAGAHLVRAGDQVSIASYALMVNAEALSFRPSLVIVDEHNHRLQALAPTSGNGVTGGSSRAVATRPDGCC